MFKKLNFKYLFVFLCLMASLVWLAVYFFPDNKLHLIFCNVGQGDATLIVKGSEEILVDGGPNDRVLTCLANNMPFWDRKIEILALTHPEADHMSGLISVMNKYDIDYLLIGPEGNESAGYEELVKKLTSVIPAPALPRGRKAGIYIDSRSERSSVWNDNNKIKIVNPYTGTKIKLGDITLNTLWPEREWVANNISKIKDQRSKIENGGGYVLGVSTEHKKLNDFSLIFFMEYRGKRVLLMGDGDSQIQDDILRTPNNALLINSTNSIDILKFPHHGSKTGITSEFLKQISPKEAVISVGKNSYGHPTKEALDMLNKEGVRVRRTDIEGDILYMF